MTTTTALTYARVSSDEQSRGYSLDTQRAAMRRYCSDRAYQLVGEYSDVHTGTEFDRPGMNALLEAVEAGKPQVIVLYDVDRLGREVIVQAILERDLMRAGARIEYVLGGDTNTPEGELLKMMKSAFAVYDNRQRVEKTRRGKRGRAQAGHVVVSRVPFGYDYISEPHKGRLERNDAEAEIVELLYDCLIDKRLSTHAITKHLWEHGIPHRGGVVDWTPTMVQKMLRSPLYKGAWAYGKSRRTKVNGTIRNVPVSEDQWIWVDVPAIITPERWEQAQLVLAENKALATRNAKREYLLSGLIYCSCGWRRNGKRNGRHGYYTCHKAEERQPWQGACAIGSFRQDRLEAAIWTYVIDELAHPDRLMAEVERQLAAQRTDGDRRARQLKQTTAALAQVDRKLGQLLTKELDGYPAEVLQRERQRLLDERRTLIEERDRLQVAQAEQDITPDMLAALYELAEHVQATEPEWTFEERRQLLRLVRLRVDVIDRETVRVSGLVGDDIVRLTSSRNSARARC